MEKWHPSQRFGLFYHKMSILQYVFTIFAPPPRQGRSNSNPKVVISYYVLTIFGLEPFHVLDVLDLLRPKTAQDAPRPAQDGKMATLQAFLLLSS